MKLLFKFVVVFLVSFNCYSQESKYPNILFIAVDDLKPTIGAFGDLYARTPELDKLAEKATVFTNNHTQQAVCGPSRASLLTGKRPDYTQVRDLKTRMRDINPGILTLPQYFKNNGYYTVGIGKIFDPRCVDKFLDKPSWSLSEMDLPKTEYPKKYGNSALGYYQNPKIKDQVSKLMVEAKAKVKGVRNINEYVLSKYKPPFEMSNAPDEAYVDGALANQAIQLLDKLGSNKQPFFLAVGFKRPHLPFTAPKAYWDLYDSKNIKFAEYQKKVVNGTELAYHNSPELRSYISPEITYKINNDNLLELNEEFQKQLIHGYYACVSFIDAQIGKILEELKQKGLDKNTIVVVWGDHGWHLGDHSMWNKHSNFEQATRSPLLIYSPKIDKKIVVDTPTEFVDIFPTLCDLADLQIPEDLDGESLKKQMQGIKESDKEYSVSQWHKGKEITGYSFRTKNYRYTVWLGNGKKSTDDLIYTKDIVAQELYDYKKDPLETTNFISDKQYKVIYDEFISIAQNYFKNEYEKKFKKQSKSIKDALKQNFNPDSVFVGATLNYNQLGTFVEEIFLKEFTYTTPENCAKQSKVHPEPNMWDWSSIDSFVAFANKNNVKVRLHGPISPQASKWAKEDHRTAEELEQNMTEYMTALCTRFNSNKAIKWMDVVNETVEKDGDWFRDKPGVEKWENPWVKMGYNVDGVPKYIVKAFEIANKNAPNLRLVFNQHGGMEPVMWEKVKKTILYLRSKGLRVDGIGWQAHLKSTENLLLDKESLNYLSELIDWAHTNKLDFHVTEIDFKILEKENVSKSLEKQAIAYSNVLKVLLSKRKSGMVTYNTWGVVDRTGRHTDSMRYIFDEKGDPKPAYTAILSALENIDESIIILE